MRHLKAGRRLSRNASHRLAMFRNMAMALFRHERIITTVEKAKEARRFIEPLITLAKKGTLHARRLVIAKLGPVAKVDLLDKEEEYTDDTVLSKLFNNLGPRFQDRPGGYTRIIKRHERRLGDAGRTAFLELLKEGETKVRAKQPVSRPAPAPKVSAEKPAESKPEVKPAPSELPVEQGEKSE